MTYINIAHNNMAAEPYSYGTYGGKTEWRNNQFMDSSSYIGDDSKEVIPVCAVNRMIPWRPGRRGSWRNHYRGMEAREKLLGGHNFLIPRIAVESSVETIPRSLENDGFIETRLRAAFQLQINGHFKESGNRLYYSPDVSGVTDEELGTLVTNAIEDVKEELQSNIKSSMDYGLPDGDYGWPQYWRYKDLIGHFIGGSGWSTHHTRTWINGNVVKYLVGSFFLADISSTANNLDNITPLVCLVTKPKYIEYLRWAIMLDKEVDHRVFQIWIHPEFDVPRSRWRGLRPYIRKQFLIPMYDAGVPVVEKETFKELFKNYDPPKLNNIRDYRKWLMDCSIESINNIKSNLQ